jgi:hypothetical protein
MPQLHCSKVIKPHSIIIFNVVINKYVKEPAAQPASTYEQSDKIRHEALKLQLRFGYRSI